MRTETLTTSTVVRIPVRLKVLGNENNAPVTSHPTSASPGDGDINTGHGGNVFASLTASCKLSGRYAKIDFTYCVWNDDFGKSSKADNLTINTSRYIDLSNYDYAPSSWNYVNLKGEKVTVQERFTYSLRTHSQAYYVDYYKAKDSRKGWYKVDNTYPKNNKHSLGFPVKN